MGPSTEDMKSHKLYPNWPNPFNPITNINYVLYESANVNLSIYNIKGQLVKTLVTGYKSKGRYSVIWRGKNYAGMDVPSGTYIYRLKINSNSGRNLYKGKMTLVK